MNYLRSHLERRRHIKEAIETQLLERNEQSNQDTERFLMELEERHSWVAYELQSRNYMRLQRLHTASQMKHHLQRELLNERESDMKESGLMLNKGNIHSFVKWQNSPAKNLDLNGHGGIVYSVKLSTCKHYIFSCSADKTAKLWQLSTGTCLIVYDKHEKKCFDCDIHPLFKHDSKEACLLVCSHNSIYLYDALFSTAIKTKQIHSETIYKSIFSPNGSSILTCSEDCSIKLTAYPELYALYTYSAHTAPVCTISFSPSGKYFISGSNYKERNILLWDACMPKITKSVQYPHIFFWSTEGLIRKICIQKTSPHWSFWLNRLEKSKCKLIVSDAWPGENAEVKDVLSDSEESDTEDASGSDDSDDDLITDPFDHPFFYGDKRSIDGARLVVLTVDQLGSVKAATEYIPGSYLVFRVQSGYDPIVEAFISVCVKGSKYDAFVPSSGDKVGTFCPDVVLPWMDVDVENCEYNALEEVYHKKEKDLSIKTDASKMTLTYRSTRPSIASSRTDTLVDGDGTAASSTEYASSRVRVSDDNAAPDGEEHEAAVEDIPPESGSNMIEIVWACPNAFDVGAVLVTVNLKLANAPHRWQALRHSLRESPIRMIKAVDDESSVASITAVVNADGERFLFDQSAQHALFWDAVNTKDWDAMDSLLDDKCVMFLQDEVLKRSPKVSSTLRHLFGSLSGLVCPTPIVYSAGCTKSSVIMDATEVPLAETDQIPVTELPLGDRVDPLFAPPLPPLPAPEPIATPAAEHASGSVVRVGILKKLDRASAAKLHSSRPTSRSANKVKLVTPIPGFRPKTIQNSKRHRYDLMSISAENATDAGKIHEKEVYDRNPFTPTLGELLKQTGFGPDTQHFCMPYPAYYPHNAGKAFRALRSRLKAIETFYLNRENARVPSLGTVDLALGKVTSTSAQPRSLFSFKSLFPTVKGFLSRSAASTKQTFVLSPAVNEEETSARPYKTNVAQFQIPILLQSKPFDSLCAPVCSLEKDGSIVGSLGMNLLDVSSKYEMNAFEMRDAYGRRACYYSLPGLESSAALASVDQMEVVDVTRSRGLHRRFRTNAGLEIAHGGTVNSVVFSPSERRVASAGGDGVIKLWNPDDGSLITSLRGPEGSEATAVLFSIDEMFLIAGSSNGSIYIWDLLESCIVKSLHGHSDCVYSLAATADVSLIVSASHDSTIKTWHLNPRRPNPPTPPRDIGRTETSIMLSWAAPASFNEDVTAFHLQYRIGLRNPWTPEPALTLPPHFRSKNVEGLVSNTGYYFRIMAENKMGASEWSEPSRQMMTKEGLPYALERPVVWDVQQCSIGLFWFVPNPLLFGSGARLFHIHTVVNGEMRTEESTWTRVTLAEGGADGAVLMDLLQSRKQEQAQVAAGRKLLSQQEFAGSVHLSSEDLELAVSREGSENLILVSACVSNLQCGVGYRFYTTCRNSIGDSPASPLSYTVVTKSGVPETPGAPLVVKAELTALTVRWDAPHDGGTAILGYRLVCEHLGHEIPIKRAQKSVTVDGLQPNTAYAMRIYAVNAAGSSPLSAPSTSVCASRTVAQAPDRPGHLRVLSATWKSMLLEGVLPYAYNVAIESLTVERRWLRPFSKGAWEHALVFRVPGDVAILPLVDEGDRSLRSSSVKSVSVESDAELVDGSTGTSLLKRAKRPVQSSLANQLERPPGNRFQATIHHLQPDTIYEFRVSCANSIGSTVFSHPSQRAKTNQIRVPLAFNAPFILHIKDSIVFLRCVSPLIESDGSPVTTVHIDTKDVIKKSSQYIHTAFEVVFDSKYAIGPLRPGGSYQFRVRGESAQGSGPASAWSETAVVPLSKPK